MGEKMPLMTMIQICPYVRISICLSFILPEFIKHQLCEPLIVKDLLTEAQIGAQAAKMLVRHQATGWWVEEVVFFTKRECIPIVFLYFYIVSKSLEICTLSQNKQSYVVVIILVVDFMNLTILSPFKILHSGKLCGWACLLSSQASPVPGAWRSNKNTGAWKAVRRQLGHLAENWLASAWEKEAMYSGDI